jgi:hypothetical protein
MRRFQAAALALLLVPATVLTAGTQKLWDFGPLSHLKRVAAEKGAPPNSQPLKVDPAILARVLGSVHFMLKGREEPLFVPAEAEAIGVIMAEALALAQPGEDLELLSTTSRGAGLIGSNRSVAATAFAADGKLNLIVREARLDVLYYPSMSDNLLPRIDFGSRAKAGGVVLKAPGAETARADWLVLPLAAAPVSAPAPVPAPAPAILPPAAAPQVAQPEPRSASIEDHLRDLKRFRDQGLITDEEYTKEKQELLKAFTSDVAR